MTEQQQTTEHPAQLLQQQADELERRLRADHPRLAAFLDMMIQPRKLWGGGYDLLGEVYPTAEAADEARRAAVMVKLMQADEAVL